MPIPTGGLTVANLDQGTDRPDLARVELLAAVNKINEVLAKLPLYADGEQSGTGTQRFGLVKVGTEATPAWPSTWRVVDLGNRTAFFEDPSGNQGIANNAFNDGTNWIARVTGVATRTQHGADGAVRTFTAPSVSAGAAYTGGAAFVERMSIANTGAVTVAGATAIGEGGQTLTLRPGAADHAYLGINARTADPGARSGYIGYGVSASTTLMIANELSGGIINLSAPGGVTTSAITGTTGTFSGAVNAASLGEFTSHPVSGYVRVGTGIYRRSAIVSYTNLTLNALATVAAPANAKSVILQIFASATSGNAVGVRGVAIQVYSDAGTTISGGYDRATFEYVATSGTVTIWQDETEVIAPVSGGNVHIKLIGDSAGRSMAAYRIVGYTT